MSKKTNLIFWEDRQHKIKNTYLHQEPYNEKLCTILDYHAETDEGYRCIVFQDNKTKNIFYQIA